MNREDFFSLLPLDQYNLNELRNIRLAYWLSKEAHRTQHRDTGERYFEHPRSVALLTLELCSYHSDIIPIALLHDAVEDSFTSPDVYISLFGAHVWNDICLLSKSIPYCNPITGQVEAYKKKDKESYFSSLQQAPWHIRSVKVCDRIHNLSTCSSWEKTRRLKYLLETEDFILPLAHDLDKRLQLRLKETIENVPTN